MSIELLSNPGDDPIVVEGNFAASPATLFRAFTDPSMVKRWFGPAPNSLHCATIDLQPGGAWRFLESSTGGSTTGFEGIYLEIVADHRLVFTWHKFTQHSDGQREATPASQVQVTIEPASGGTTNLRIVHSKVHDQLTRKGFGRGWRTGLGHLQSTVDQER